MTLGAGHSHPLYVHGHSPVHLFASEAKVVVALGCVVAVAVTPREAVWAFALYALGVGVLVAVSGIRPGFVGLRLLAVVPFIVFALFIPFIAGGDTVEVGWMTLSRDGLWGTWNILAKATLGASVSVLLTATTEVPDIIRGLTVLRVPALLTSIAMFMVRYLELIADELRRMRIAMTARGFEPRWLSQARPIASSAGALFVRSYERGERVHAAMVARGFTGTMPALGHRRATTHEWRIVVAVLSVPVVIAVLALVTA